jgi:ATP adenylyltransferase
VDYLWSPWRMEYIRSAQDDSAGCFLCDKQHLADDDALILARTDLAIVLLNAYPYNPGHMLAAPKRHVAQLEDLDEAELGETSSLLQRSIRALKEAVEPHGFNLGINLGRVAGAGVPDHVHWHIVPRWNGDTNFMPVTGKTRVLPELLADTWSKLRPRF